MTTYSKNMSSIDINELPEYSPWVARLLGVEPFKKLVRNQSMIDTEYDEEKYASLLEYYQKEDDINIKDIKSREIQQDTNATCISVGGRLFRTSINEYQQLIDSILVQTIAKSINEAKVVVELGCGYGYNLSVLNNCYHEKVWLGGEYSKNAVKLAGSLFADSTNLSVSLFNWYDEEWSIFDNIDGEALLFTCHAIEQLPSVQTVLQTLKKYKDKITEVVFLEPIYELNDINSTLGLMRRAYTTMNDYNIDLLTTIEGIGGLILEKQYDLIGGNPLNPTSLIRWKLPDKQNEARNG